LGQAVAERHRNVRHPDHPSWKFCWLGAWFGGMSAEVDRPLVKVVLTSYNRRELLKVAVGSVLDQTYENFHIVIVDDASTDGSSELAVEFEKSNPGRVTAIVKSENRGLADSIRVGIRSPPRADYVAILNEDDRWMPEKLELQLRHFQLDPAVGLVFTEAVICDEHSTLTGQVFSDIYGRFAKFDFDDALRGNHSCASTHMITTEIADVVADSMPDPSAVSDYYITLVAAGLSKIAMVDTPLAVYQESSSGLHAQGGRMQRDTTIARECLFERLPNLAMLAGGPRGLRRRLAWLTFDLALYSLADGDFTTYAWQIRRGLRQRAVKPTVWVALHSLPLLPRLVARPLR
jgi:glycosyltransferase involved in cell wall biosynthesis